MAAPCTTRRDQSPSNHSLLSPAPFRRAGQASLWTALGLALATALTGCQDTNRSPHPRQFGGTETRTEMNEGNLLYAFSVLRNVDKLQTPATLATVVERLNQWSQQAELTEDWSLDPLVETLPAELRESAALSQLGEPRFLASDGRELQQTVWLSEIARRARGEDNAPVAAAQELFDWVVRNIQLDRDGTVEVPHLPRELLIFGHGTAADRAWLFALLARQQGLDVVQLALPGKEGEPRLWLSALATDGELYLYDARLGLPIPGPAGHPVATLKEVLADEGLLRQLDVDEQHPYPVTAADLEKITVLIEGSPLYLARRMSAVETELPGKESLILSARPSALAERVKSHPHIESVRLWPLPYERNLAVKNMDRATREKMDVEFRPFLEPTPNLWQARTLHLLGVYDGDQGANALYQAARQADADMDAAQRNAPPQDRPRVDLMVALMKVGKQDASYWLGLIAYERGNYAAAVDYLQTRTLAATPDGPWTAGAHYNLGRTLELLKRPQEAVRQYQADRSAQRQGNLLRARRLEQSASADKAGDQPAA